tara:strand:- start:2169 stop:3509 length:1341 start_codon:yes stop_codon:yes gene_type:complete
MLDSLLNTFANAWYSHGAIQSLGEGLLISAVVFTIFLALDRMLRARLSTQSQHLLILGGFASVLLGFTVSQTNLPSAGAAGPVAGLLTLTVHPGAIKQSGLDWGALLLTLYLVPVLLLVSRLLLGLWQLHKLRASSAAISDTGIQAEFAQLQHRLHISRKVSVRTSSSVHSPLSFGSLRPLVLLPIEALQWPEQTLRHVLAHELSHVQRGDWLSKLLCYVLASMLWLNPLGWRLLKRLDASAESACDMQAAALESDNSNYATSLISVARCAQQHAVKPPLFAQTMLDRSTLETRIVHLLEGKTMQTKELKKERRNVLFSLALLSSMLILTLANTKIVSAQPSGDGVMKRGEILPLETIIPYYPRAAVDQKIEGWAQVRFSIGIDGLVVADSVEVIDAEPVSIFDNSAIAATKQFRFTKYAPDGFPVIVPNVQYVFRYKLSDDEKKS